MAVDTNPSPNEDKEKQEKLKALSEALGLNHFQTEIDSLKENMGYVRKITEESALRLNDVITAVNNLTVAAQGGQVPNPTAGSTSTLYSKSSNLTGLLADPAAAQGLVTLLEGLGKAWTAFRGTPQTAIPNVNFAEMGAEFMQLLMKTSFDKLLMSTYDVHLPPPKKLIDKVTSQNAGVQHELQ